MSYSKSDFIQLCIENNILRFGEFTLKSGRLSPYFFNAGLFNTGNLLSELGRFYAQLIVNKVSSPYMLYGPAYKGIPLVAAIAVQLAQHQNQDISYAFNRKEAKDHGEGGTIVGAPLNGNVIIVDDVITAGTSANESVEIIKSANAKPSCIVIAVDRQEVADGEKLSAVEKVKQRYDMPVHAMIQLDDLIQYLHQTGDQKYLDAVSTYREKYGIK